MDAVGPGPFFSFRTAVYLWHTAWMEPDPYGCSRPRPIFFFQNCCVPVTQCMNGAWSSWMQWAQANLFRSELLFNSDTMHEWSLALMDAVAPGPFISFRTPVYLWHNAWVEPGLHGCSSAQANLFRSELLFSSDTVPEWSLALIDAVPSDPFISFRTPL